MDNRKKQINELEQRKRDQIVSLDALLTRFGESLLSRADSPAQENNAAFEEFSVYQRFKKDIADSEATIQAAEEQMRRFSELEESIEVGELEESTASKELTALYGRLGKQLLDESAHAGNYSDFCAPYRDQGNALITKIIFLEERLAKLEQRDDSNVFIWISRSAQGMVVRSFLTRAQETLEQLHRNMGEHYSRHYASMLVSGEADNGGEFAETAVIENLCAEIERRRAEARVRLQGLTELKEEQRKISVSHSEGGPLRQIQTLKKHIAYVRDELKSLYRGIGTEAASLDGGRRPVIDSLVMPEDQDDLDNAARINRLIHDDESTIKKLQASLAIDEEKTKIEKYRKMIQEKHEKIAQAEKSIMEFEENIRVSETHITKLQSEG